MKLSNIYDLPPVRQQHNYDCGAAALRSVTKYYDLNLDNDELIQICKTTEEQGTTPENITKAAKQLGLQAQLSTGLTISDLRQALHDGKQIICAIQAYGNPTDYSKNDNGHYVIVIGSDDNNLYFEDPSMEDTRGKLPIKEFQRRWHDENNTKKYNNLGIIVGKKDAPKTTTKIKSAKPIS